MSAARWMREIAFAGGKVALSLLAWLLIASWAALVPRRRDRIAVIGRGDGQFLDNAKYFFLQAKPLLAPGTRMVFVTERRDVLALLADSGCEVMRYPSLRCIRYLLCCGVVVVDSSEWFARLRRFVLVRAKVVQLWHGVGFKRIGLDKWAHEIPASRVLSAGAVLGLRRCMHMVTGRLARYALVNTTSTFYRDEVFQRAMLAKHFTVFGYPRNTFGQRAGPADTLVQANVDVAVAKLLPAWIDAGRRMVLVAPTYRDSGSAPMGLTPEVVTLLDAFAADHGVEFVFKFHLFEANVAHIAGAHVHVFDARADVYPLLPVAAAMVTDYSSIYMDYLLLDRPVLFLVPDLGDYIQRDRQIQFPFDEMTPGPKLTSWRELLDSLLAQWAHDAFAADRARLRRLAFDGIAQEEAVPKLIGFMAERGWIAAPQAPRRTEARTV